MPDKLLVPRVDKDLFGAVNKIGITVVHSHVTPYKRVEIIQELHRINPFATSQ